MMGLRVVSFNIRYATAPDGEHAWEQRKDHLAARLRMLAPDLLGIQECRADGQLQDLMAGLPDYGIFGMPRGGDSDAALEMAPVLFRKDRFRQVGGEVLWMSETPRVPGSMSWGSALQRTLTWVFLEEAGRQIWFGNVHLDHWSLEARERSAGLIADLVRGRPAGEVRILSGDFNTVRGTPPHAALVEVLEDPFGNEDDELAGSFHAYGLLDPPVGIDWVLVDPSLRVVDFRVDAYRPDGRYLSDHDPVVVDLLEPQDKESSLKVD